MKELLNYERQKIEDLWLELVDGRLGVMAMAITIIIAVCGLIVMYVK
jgi:hypothetical protein